MMNLEPSSKKKYGGHVVLSFTVVKKYLLELYKCEDGVSGMIFALILIYTECIFKNHFTAFPNIILR